MQKKKSVVLPGKGSGWVPEAGCTALCCGLIDRSTMDGTGTKREDFSTGEN